MIWAGAALARRIEAGEAAIARGCAQGQPGSALLEIAGAIASKKGPQA